jgi:cysteine desulfurase
MFYILVWGTVHLVCLPVNIIISTWRHTLDNCKPLYLDNNATTQVDPRVLETAVHFMRKEYGNAGSRTHKYGTTAKQAVAKARRIIADSVNSTSNDIIFTSGATESNNLAILGLAPYGIQSNLKHIISTPIEHKAVLEPLEQMAKQGFEISYLPVGTTGAVNPDDVIKLLRDDTLLVSVMHANNETGVIQPINEIAAILKSHSAYFHTDAAQTFGKLIDPLTDNRIDFISASGHKLFSPKGVGCLIARNTKRGRSNLSPLFWGGGQENGLRAGTHAVPLIAAFGHSVELAIMEHDNRLEKCEVFRNKFYEIISDYNPVYHGTSNKKMANVFSLSIPPFDADALILLLNESFAISTGSACTSQSYSTSHVLEAMGIDDELNSMAIRVSWSHLSDPNNLQLITNYL